MKANAGKKSVGLFSMPKTLKGVKDDDNSKEEIYMYTK